MIIKQGPKGGFQRNLYESKAWKDGHFVCGIDEVGRGCLAGPVVASAAIIPPRTQYPLLRDSKTLSLAQRLEAYEWIVKNCHHATALVSWKLIDKENIYHATLHTMRKAFSQLLCTLPFPVNKLRYILVDAMPLSVENPFEHDIQCRYFPKGETRSASIAAASIVAKVTRDRLMEKLSIVFPHFALESHKGYGTTQHQDCLSQWGPTVIHRKTFLKERVKQDESMIQKSVF